MRKRRKKMRATVQKVLKPAYSGEKEKAQLEIKEADDLYREIRVENTLTDETGKKSELEPGEEVDVVIEADTDADTKVLDR